MALPLFSFDTSKGETPETLKNRRAIAMQLARGSGKAPASIPEGINAIGDAILYRSLMSQSDAAEKTGRSSATDAISGLLGGMGGSIGGAPVAAPAAPAPPPQPVDTSFGGDQLLPPGSSVEMTPQQAAPAPQAGGPDYGNAIASVESGGKYDILGPVTKTGDRAYGKYQIMGNNIPEWSKAALGQEVSPQQFLSDPKLQDAVFQHRFGQYVSKYGPEGAAKAWFAGEGGMNNPGARDQLGTSVTDYGRKFMSALGPQAAQQPPTQVASLDPSAGMSPEAATAPQDNVTRVAQAMQGQGFKLNVPGQQAAPQAPMPTTPQAQQPAQGSNIPKLMEAARNPWLNDAEKGIVNTLLKNELEKMDPTRKLQAEKLGLEVGNLKNPKAPDSFRALDERAKAAGLQQGTPEYQRFMANDGKPQQQFRQATPDELKNYGAPAGQFGPDGRFYPVNPPSGTSLQVNPETGAVTFQQGSGVKPLTEAQSKDVLFTTRMTNAQPTLDKYEKELLSLPGALSGSVPMNLGNYMQSEGYQIARDAGRDFVAAILRKDSGAAITANEEKIYGEMYLPQPGDKPGTLEMKRQRRAVALEAVKAGMPASAVESMVRAIKASPAIPGEIQTDIPGVKIKRLN